MDDPQYLANIAPEIVERIAEHAQPQDLLALRLVCKEVERKVFRTFASTHFQDREVLMTDADLSRLIDILQHPILGNELAALRIVLPQGDRRPEQSDDKLDEMVWYLFQCREFTSLAIGDDWRLSPPRGRRLSNPVPSTTGWHAPCLDSVLEIVARNHIFDITELAAWYSEQGATVWEVRDVVALFPWLQSLQLRISFYDDGPVDDIAMRRRLPRILGRLPRLVNLILILDSALDRTDGLLNCLYDDDAEFMEYACESVVTQLFKQEFWTLKMFTLNGGIVTLSELVKFVNDRAEQGRLQYFRGERLILACNDDCEAEHIHEKFKGLVRGLDAELVGGAVELEG